MNPRRPGSGMRLIWDSRRLPERSMSIRVRTGIEQGERWLTDSTCRRVCQGTPGWTRVPSLEKRPDVFDGGFLLNRNPGNARGIRHIAGQGGTVVTSPGDCVPPPRGPKPRLQCSGDGDFHQGGLRGSWGPGARRLSLGARDPWGMPCPGATGQFQGNRFFTVPSRPRTSDFWINADPNQETARVVLPSRSATPAHGRTGPR